MFQGSIVAVITPFTADLELDLDSLSRLVEWHVESGTDALLCCGITGEAPTLSDEEALAVMRTCVRAARGRIPIIAGTGSCDTRRARALTERAKEVGVAACLVITPYYNKPTPEGCLAHYRELSNVGLPIIIYHHPHRTGLKLSIDVLAGLCALPNIVAVKEGSGDLEYTIEFIRKSPVPVLSGDDIFTPALLSVGAKGIVSMVANVIPAEWRSFVHHPTVAEYQRLYPLCKSLVLEINPQGVKYALSVLGRCLPHLRLPLVEPRAATKQAIEEALSSLSLRNERVQEVEQVL